MFKETIKVYAEKRLRRAQRIADAPLEAHRFIEES
jgi:hypothetical protein